MSGTTKGGHCWHECVCHSYQTREAISLLVPCESGSAEYEMCPHDTRKQPSAEQRIERAIKELDKKMKKANSEISHEFLEQDTYREGVAKTCKEAISLLRGERG